MTKKKRELIEILLDNIKPEDWPENFQFASQDKCDAAVYVYSGMPDSSSVYNGAWACGSLDCKYITMLDVLCKHWSKAIVHRDEFMKRWNERSVAVEVKTPQQLALEKFGTDWHDNEGAQPVGVMCWSMLCFSMKRNYIKEILQEFGVGALIENQLQRLKNGAFTAMRKSRKFNLRQTNLLATMVLWRLNRFVNPHSQRK